ncbi:MAG: hypothetical protein KAT53_04095 [Dehalococcoidia bacterium]|nr:hypothetical protein [Dehalococcoidia bacterium]
MMGDEQIVWFFDEPTIGFCPECERTAIYIEGEGFVCPICRTRELSLFLWDKESPHPEGG